MTVTDYQRLSVAQKLAFRMERYCDGNWGAKNPGLRKLVTVDQMMRCRRKCDREA